MDFGEILATGLAGGIGGIIGSTVGFLLARRGAKADRREAGANAVRERQAKAAEAFNADFLENVVPHLPDGVLPAGRVITVARRAKSALEELPRRHPGLANEEVERRRRALDATLLLADHDAQHVRLASREDPDPDMNAWVVAELGRHLQSGLQVLILHEELSESAYPGPAEILRVIAGDAAGCRLRRLSDQVAHISYGV